MFKITRHFRNFIDSLTDHSPRWWPKFLQQAAGAVFANRGSALTCTNLADLLREGGLGVPVNSREYNTLARYFSRCLARKPELTEPTVRAYLATVRPYLGDNDGEGVTVGVDGSDIQKPHSKMGSPRAMQGTSRVRDGSASRKGLVKVGVGYESLTVEAALPGGVQVPLLHWLIGAVNADPLFGSCARGIDARHIEGVRYVAPFVGPRAMWVFDRGYCARKYFSAWDDLGLRWITRLSAEGVSGTRWITTDGGVAVHLDEFVHRLPLDIKIEPGAGGLDGARVGMAHIRLGAGATVEQRVRTLLVVWFEGASTPFALLGSEPMELTAATAEWLRAQYRRRWRVEESHRLAKDALSHGGAIESFRTRNFTSSQRLVLLWMLVQGFVALQLLKNPPGLQAVQASIEGKWALGPKDTRSQLTKLLGQRLRLGLPALRERLRLRRTLRHGTPEEKRAEAERRLRAIAKEERLAVLAARRRAAETARLKRRLDQVGQSRKI